MSCRFLDSKKTYVALCLLMLIAGVLSALPYAKKRETQVFFETDGRFVLDKGIYEFQTDYYADAIGYAQIVPEEEGAIRSDLLQYLNAHGQTTRARIYADQNQAAATFAIREALPDAHLQVYETRVVYQRRLSTTYAFFRAAFPFLIAIAAALLLRFLLRANKEGIDYTICALYVLILLINLPLIAHPNLYGHDVKLHMQRAAVLGKDVTNGIFPVRLYSGWFNDYGYPLGVFYADLFFYFPAALFALGLPMWQSLRWYLAAINVACVCVSYYSFSRIAQDKRIGVFGAYLYAASMWYLTDVYTRCAAGEATAMVFLPLVALGFYRIATDEKKKGAVTLAIGFTGLLQSHLVTSLIAAFFSVLLCLFGARVFLKKTRLLAIGKAAGIAAALNAGFLVPFLDGYARYDVAVSHMKQELQGYGVEFAQLFGFAYNVHGRLAHLGETTHAEEMPQALGCALVLMVPVGVLLFFFEKEKQKRARFLLCASLSALAIFMASCYFPYHAIRDNFPQFYETVMERVDFAFRHFTVATCILSLIAVFAATYLRAQSVKKARIFIGVVGAAALLQSAVMVGAYATAEDGAVYIDTAGLDVYEDSNYVFADLDRNEMPDARLLIGEGSALTISDVERQGVSNWSLRIEERAGEDATASFPIWYYDGYRAVSSDGTRLALADGEKHRATLTVPASFSGVVTIDFREPWYWRAAEIVSVLTAAGLLLFYQKKRSA